MNKGMKILATAIAALCLVGCAVQTGWQQLDGSVYYFSEDCTPVTGQNRIDGKTYFFDSQGKLITGWYIHDGQTYCLQQDGTPVTGWMAEGDDRYYFSPEGMMTRGWVQIDGKTHYFGLDGLLVRGWTDIGGQIYYFDTDGTPITGKQELNGLSYLFGEDGSMYTGWYTEGDRQYYYKEDGSMAVGRTQIDGDTYYFSPHGVHLWLVNPWNPIPDDYYVELTAVETFDVSTACADALVRMLDDCRAAGFDPAICSIYRTMEDQIFLYNRKLKNVIAAGYDEEEARVIAAKEVAVPGTSEHHLGLAIDILDNAYWVLDEKQAEMPTQQWLMEHCWEYGFILRYPVGSTDITGIVYEPWHYRYVGVDIALELRDLGITLEEYLGAADRE